MSPALGGGGGGNTVPGFIPRTLVQELRPEGWTLAMVEASHVQRGCPYGTDDWAVVYWLIALGRTRREIVESGEPDPPFAELVALVDVTRAVVDRPGLAEGGAG